MNEQLNELIKKCQKPIVIKYEYFDNLIDITIDYLNIRFYNQNKCFVSLAYENCCENKKEIYKKVKKDLENNDDLFLKYKLINKIVNFENLYKSILNAISTNQNFHLICHNGFIVYDGLENVFIPSEI